MKAAVLTQKETFEIREFPMPEIDSHSVLVKMEACAVCNATDTKLFTGKHALSAFPSIIGHEGVGIVEAVGTEVTRLKPGDRILGGSFYCSEMPSLWGAYTQYGTSGENAVIVPPSVKPEHAALAHMLSEAINAVRIADIHAEDNVVIVGAGAVGCSILSILNNTLHRKTIVVDVLDSKLEMASQLGADVVINSQREDVEQRVKEITGGAGVSRIFDAVGRAESYAMDFTLINPKGVIVPFGLIEGTLEIPFRTLYYKEVQLRWCKGSGVTPAEDQENRELALHLIEKGLIPAESLITSVLPFERLAEAFQKIKEGNQIRVILKME